MNAGIQQIVASEKTYEPADTVTEQLRHVTLAPIIGPVAVGKSACIEYIASHDSKFGRVQSFTTRPRRPNEPNNEYRFLPHESEATIADIAHMVSEGLLVQYAVHPTTGYIYGSDLSDYARPNMLLDTLASAVPAIRKLPFGQIKEISLVTEPHEWIRRFSQRNTSPTERAQRLQEGIASLTWSLEQGDNMLWACSVAGRNGIQKTGQHVRNLVLETEEPNPSVRRVGEKLLRALLAEQKHTSV